MTERTVESIKAAIKAKKQEKNAFIANGGHTQEGGMKKLKAMEDELIRLKSELAAAQKVSKDKANEDKAAEDSKAEAKEKAPEKPKQVSLIDNGSKKDWYALSREEQKAKAAEWQKLPDNIKSKYKGMTDWYENS